MAKVCRSCSATRLWSEGIRRAAESEGSWAFVGVAWGVEGRV